MKERTRNVLVGLTVAVALAVLGGMIVIFEELPGFMRLGYPVHIRFPGAGGLVKGSDVMLAGQRVGRVTEVAFVEGDARKGVTVTVMIDHDVNVPGTVNAYIRSRGFTGNAMVDLAADGKGPGAEREMAWLPKDAAATIHGTIPTDGGLIPAELQDEIRTAVVSVRRLADGVTALIGPPPGTETAPATEPAIRGTLARLDAALDSITAVVGHPDNQANIKAALANFKSAAAATTEAMTDMKDVMAKARSAVDKVASLTENVSNATKDVTAAARGAGVKYEQLAERLMVSADKLDRALTAIEVAAAKIDRGEGTAGKLLNDPALYNGLLDTTTELKEVMRGMRELIAHWKAEGVKIQLK